MHRNSVVPLCLNSQAAFGGSLLPYLFFLLLLSMKKKNSGLHLVILQKKSQESGGLGYLLPAAFHFGDCGEEQQNCLCMVIL